jgi:hypothetical protein
MTGNNQYTTKPIEDVKNTLHSINRNMNQLKTDVVCIKADLSIIKDYIRKKEQEEKEKEESLKVGWFFT